MPLDEYVSIRALKKNRRVESVRVGIVKSKDEIAWIDGAAVLLGDYGVIVTYREINSVAKPPKSGARERK